MRLLARVVMLYVDMDRAIREYTQLTWVEVGERVDEMAANGGRFQSVCRKVPPELQGDTALAELRRRRRLHGCRTALS